MQTDDVHTPLSQFRGGAADACDQDSGYYSRPSTPTPQSIPHLRDSTSSSSTDSVNASPLYVFLDSLRNIHYLSKKTPLELSREAQHGMPTVTSSHGMYRERSVDEPPDPGCVFILFA